LASFEIPREILIFEVFYTLKSLITWIFSTIKWSLGILTVVVLVSWHSVLGDSVLCKGCGSTGLESLEGQDGTASPGKNGEEGKEYGANDVGAGEIELDLFSFAPSNDHINEGDEIKKGPQTGECHVEYDVVFASLDGGHLFKKPFSHEESNGGQKGHNANHGGKVAGSKLHVHHTNLHIFFLQEKPPERGNAAKNDNGKKQSADSHANDGPAQECEGVGGPAGLGPSKGPLSVAPRVHPEVFLKRTNLAY